MNRESAGFFCRATKSALPQGSGNLVGARWQRRDPRRKLAGKLLFGSRPKPLECPNDHGGRQEVVLDGMPAPEEPLRPVAERLLRLLPSGVVSINNVRCLPSALALDKDGGHRRT